MASLLSTFHRAQEHDLGALVERRLPRHLLAVHRDGHLGVGRDADHREQVVDRGPPGYRVTLRPVGAAWQEAPQVSEERDHHRDGPGVGPRRVAGPGHDNYAGVYCATSPGTDRSSRGDS